MYSHVRVTSVGVEHSIPHRMFPFGDWLTGTKSIPTLSGGPLALPILQQNTHAWLGPPE